MSSSREASNYTLEHTEIIPYISGDTLRWLEERKGKGVGQMADMRGERGWDGELKKNMTGLLTTRELRLVDKGFLGKNTKFVDEQTYFCHCEMQKSPKIFGWCGS